MVQALGYWSYWPFVVSCHCKFLPSSQRRWEKQVVAQLFDNKVVTVPCRAAQSNQVPFAGASGQKVHDRGACDGVMIS